VVILAGGSGTRLWPASRRDFPKQFLNFGGELSLFQQTLKRALYLQVAGSILVVSHHSQVEEIIRQSSKLLEDKEDRSAETPPVLLLAEPEGKNTAPAIAFACSVISRMAGEKSSLLVLAADHLIEPLSAFKADVEKAALLAEEGYLVTFGIPPERPETGYGYLERGGKLSAGFLVKRFKEKPDQRAAQQFLRQGGHFWNSGMFIFKAGLFFEELMARSPEIAAPFLKGFKGIGDIALPRGKGIQVYSPEAPLPDVYRQIPAISVDFALMEKSSKCAMVEATFGWSDVGSWDEAARLFGGAEYSGHGRVFSIESRDNYILTDIPVALAGVSDLIVVVKNGTLLICRRGESQLVKEMVSRVEEAGGGELL
jgi:mannose-1-phosphate guanylyltransferase/mannose-6-phosphate isomerase